jgi:hypothetical protein
MQLFWLEGEPRGDLNLTRGVEEAAVVAARELTERALVGSDTSRRGCARAQLICRCVDAIEVLMIGNVEEVADQLQTVTLRDRNLLLDAKVIDDLARLLVRVGSDRW